MVARAVKQHKAICQVLTADKNKHLVHTWQEMDLLKSMSDAQSQLLNLTDFQSGKSCEWVCYYGMPLQHFLRTKVVKLDTAHKGCPPPWSVFVRNTTKQKIKCWSHDSRHKGNNNNEAIKRMAVSGGGGCLQEVQIVKGYSAYFFLCFQFVHLCHQFNLWQDFSEEHCDLSEDSSKTATL